MQSKQIYSKKIFSHLVHISLIQNIQNNLWWLAKLSKFDFFESEILISETRYSFESNFLNDWIASGFYTRVIQVAPGVNYKSWEKQSLEGETSCSSKINRYPLKIDGEEFAQIIQARPQRVKEWKSIIKTRKLTISKKPFLRFNPSFDLCSALELQSLLELERTY